MKYQANPVVVNAFKILAVEKLENGGQQNSFRLTIGDGSPNAENERVIATPEMCSRMDPKVGDYWVIQSDGYIYLNPQKVFERKYSLVHMNALELGAAVRAAGLAGE